MNARAGAAELGRRQLGRRWGRLLGRRRLVRQRGVGQQLLGAGLERRLLGQLVHGGAGNFWAGFGMGALTSWGLNALYSPAYAYSSMGYYPSAWRAPVYGSWGLERWRPTGCTPTTRTRTSRRPPRPSWSSNPCRPRPSAGGAGGAAGGGLRLLQADQRRRPARADRGGGGAEGLRVGPRQLQGRRLRPVLSLADQALASSPTTRCSTSSAPSACSP